MAGKFIVFEGGEGCGKTTQIKLLANYLKKKGKKVLLAKEPGGTVIADKIREIILAKYPEQVVPRAELLLFLASRAQHVQTKIIPALKKGYWVLCDRFSGSTLAYQIGARGLKPADLIIKMEAFSRANLIPDLVLYFNLDPKIGLARKSTNHLEFNRLDAEKLKFHIAVRKYFNNLAKQTNWKTINAAQNIKQVQQAIIHAITNKKN